MDGRMFDGGGDPVSDWRWRCGRVRAVRSAAVALAIREAVDSRTDGMMRPNAEVTGGPLAARPVD